jgi:chloramphenicol-sensitive protein RarD
MSAPAAASREGMAAALGAYVIWGLVPIFFKQLAGVPALEIIAHRVLWSLGFIGGLLLWRGQLGAVWAAARTAAAATLIMINWITFVWAVNAGRILETSLGYFITPLLSIALGVVDRKE